MAEMSDARLDEIDRSYGADADADYTNIPTMQELRGPLIELVDEVRQQRRQVRGATPMDEERLALELDQLRRRAEDAESLVDQLRVERASCELEDRQIDRVLAMLVLKHGGRVEFSEAEMANAPQHGEFMCMRELTSRAMVLAFQPATDPDQLAAPEPERLSEAEFDAWPAAMRPSPDVLEAENKRLWERAAEADLARVQAELRAAKLRLVLSSTLRLFTEKRRGRDEFRSGWVEAARIERWRRVFSETGPGVGDATAEPQKLIEALEPAGYEFRANGPFVHEVDEEHANTYPSGWTEGYWPERRPLYPGPWERMDGADGATREMKEA